MKSRDDDGGELSLIRIGFLEEEDVGALISARTETLEQSRAAAKERGYYEQKGKNETSWVPFWAAHDDSSDR